MKSNERYVAGWSFQRSAANNHALTVSRYIFTRSKREIHITDNLLKKETWQLSSASNAGRHAQVLLRLRGRCLLWWNFLMLCIDRLLDEKEYAYAKSCSSGLISLFRFILSTLAMMSGRWLVCWSGLIHTNIYHRPWLLINITEDPLVK